MWWNDELKGQTESGLEEFILWVSDGLCTVVMRDNGDGRHESTNWESPPEGVTVVKAYGSPDWIAMGASDNYHDAVIIGYCERRLTTHEEWRIRQFVATYWDIPF